MTQRKRFVSWVAVSSLPQAKKISLEDQRVTNHQHIAKHGGTLIAELAIPGKSRSIVTWEEACRTIDAYAELCDLIEARAFDVLVFRDNSRLGRTTSLVVTIAELCVRAGIVMYSTESPPTNLDQPVRNLATRITDVFQSVMAQEEVDKFKRRNEMGMKARVMRGDFPGMVPYGWVARHKVEDGHPVTVIEIDEQPAAAIRMIVDLYLRKGHGMRPIATALNAHGYQAPRGGPWRIGTVSQALDLIWRYAGFVEINAGGESARQYVRAKSRWPAIITEAEAAAVIKERKYRAVSKRRVGSNHRYSGVVWCVRCQRRMSGSRETVRDADGNFTHYRYRYICRDMENLRRHTKPEIAASFIEKALRNAFVYLQDESNHAIVLADSATNKDAIQGRIDETQAAIARQGEALQRADDAFVDGKMDMERYNKQVERIKRQWEILQGELTDHLQELENTSFAEQRGERLAEMARNGIAMLETKDLATANAWLRRHVRVWVDNQSRTNRISIEYL